MIDIKYKHDLITTDELKFTKEHMISVGMLYEKIPMLRRKADNSILIGEQFAPPEFVITNISPGSYAGDDRTYYVTYLNLKEGKQKNIQVHHMFQFAKFTGSHAKKVLSKTREAMFINLKDNLHHSFTIGSDPEIFVEDKKGVVIPAFNFLGSKVERKHQHGAGHGIYWDGFQAEFETLGTGTCLEGQTGSVQQGLASLLIAAKVFNNDAKLSTKTVMEIPQDILDKSKTEHVSLGCMPSFNVYGMKGEPVQNPRLLPIRPAGGHIHFGMGPQTHESIKNGVKALDAILGVCCVALFDKYDNPVRRNYYGLAGEYRLPAHGLEYRTLSNAWLIHPLIMNFVFDFGRKALMFGQNGFMEKWKATEAETIHCINNCDVKLAQDIMDRNKETIIKLFQAAYGNYIQGAEEALYTIFYKGMDVIVKKPEDFTGNWNLNGNLYHGNMQMTKCKHSIPEIIAAAKKVA